MMPQKVEMVDRFYKKGALVLIKLSCNGFPKDRVQKRTFFIFISKYIKER